MTQERELERAADLLRAARRALAFTGAGISTPSGIPDYRSPGVGLWEKLDPMASASLRAFSVDPESFYRNMQPLVKTWLAAKPNAAHRALADLESWGYLACIITQNVDNLHQRSGSKNVWELHGKLRQAKCLRCNCVLDADGLLADYVARQVVPRCAVCGSPLKPDVVLFGESLPRYIFMEAAGEAERADLVLVVGSSLEVAPASDLPYLALRHGAKIVVMNSAPTPIDAQAAAVVRGDLAVMLPRLAQMLATTRQTHGTGQQAKG